MSRRTTRPSGVGAFGQTGVRVMELRRKIFRALKAANAPIALGTDSPQMFSVPGFSTHRELKLMVDEIGYTPYQALETGTLKVAEVLRHHRRQRHGCAGQARGPDSAECEPVGEHREYRKSRGRHGERSMDRRERDSEEVGRDRCEGGGPVAVKVKCFECDALMEADEPDALVDAFVAHGRENHTWSYPEQAIRNYACNYAEATVRLTGSTERRPEIGEVTVHSVTKDRVHDWLRFFDYDAFAGNPGWASCYCLSPHVPAPPEQPERTLPRETRATVAESLRRGTTFGYLAYVDGRPAGWVNASLRSDYGLYQGVDPAGPEPRSVIGVSCFVIAPPFRRHGIASALLDRAIADASARGAAWIEAYPDNKPEEGDEVFSAACGRVRRARISSRSRCGNATQ